MYRGDKETWYVSIAEYHTCVRAHGHTCTSTCATKTCIHMPRNFWLIYFSPRPTENTFVFLWVFKALWFWCIALGAILLWAQDQWASAWQGFTVGTQSAEKKTILKTSFKLYQAFNVIWTAGYQHRVTTDLLHHFEGCCRSKAYPQRPVLWPGHIFLSQKRHADLHLWTMAVLLYTVPLHQ